MTDYAPCPCMSGLPYAQCCLPLLSGAETAGTAAALMRSRYSAYCRGDTAYLLKTWHPSTRPSAIDPATIPDWCRLEILSTEKGLAGDDEGIVEFRAIAVSRNETVGLHEVSSFVREAGQWLYVTGEIRTPCKAGPESTKVGRNDPCPCGSGKKFKKCCGP
ncbi:MAG: YchJ family protein [Desulfocapsaceae bacterium]|nr:YchJ family protein [Desulfocapsaceae bacterium]